MRDLTDMSPDTDSELRAGVLMYYLVGLDKVPQTSLV